MPHINSTGIMAKHPFWQHVHDPERGVRSISDLVSVGAWHRNPLYGEVFAPDGIEDQLNMEILGDCQRFTTVNLLRSRRGFTVDEREIFQLLQPHFTRAFQNAALVQTHGLVDAQNTQRRLFSVETSGRVLASQQHSFAEFVSRLSRGHSLLSEIETWLRHSVSCLNQGLRETRIAPYQHSLPGGHWEFVLYRDFERAPYVLLVREPTRKPTAGILSPREEEILQWVSEGKSNEEIALILGRSAHTIKTHVKHVLKKLGVENRTAAASEWRQRRRPGDPENVHVGEGI
jgi:DNA-binding CsgD family transcriptional regulator